MHLFVLIISLGVVFGQVKFPGESQSSDTQKKIHEPISQDSVTTPVEGDAQSRFFNIPNLFDKCTYKCGLGLNKGHDDHCCRKGHSQCCLYGHSQFGQVGFPGHPGGYTGGYPGGYPGGHLGGYPGGYQGGFPGAYPGIGKPGISHQGFARRCPPGPGLFGRSDDSHKILKRETKDETTKASTRFLPIGNPFCRSQCHSDYDCYHLGPGSTCCIDFHNCKKCYNPYHYG